MTKDEISANIDCLSEEEFINYIKDREYTKNNSDLLNIALNNGFSLNTILYFNMEAFDDNNCYLFIEKYKVTEEEYRLNIKLLDNEFIKQSAIRTYPNLVNYVSIDENVVNWLSTIDRDYNINEDIIISNKYICNNTTIIKKALKKNPSLIRKLIYLNEDIVNYSIELGYVPTKEDFMHNMNLCDYEKAIMTAFEKDPSIIIFMNDNLLNYSTVFSASTRGYLLSMDDIKFNPGLGAYCTLVRPVLKDNPELIKYIKEGCYLQDEEIKGALKNVTITRNDFIKNPSLCKIGPLMAILRDEYSDDYKLYSSFLTDDEKIDIISNYMDNNKSMKTLPFFQKEFGSKVDAEKLDELLDILKFDFSNDDLNLQTNYFKKLDTIIDGILRLRYDKSKKHILYSDIVAVNNDIVQCFKKLSRNSEDNSPASDLANKLYDFTGNTIEYDFIVNTLKDYYDLFMEKGFISLINTSLFCNIILNYNRNYFMSNEKKKVINELKEKLEISNKKKKGLVNRKKLDIITNCIICKDYNKIGFTAEGYDKHIDTVTNFYNDRNIKKYKINISNEQYLNLKNEFKKLGELDKDIVMNILGIDNEEAAQYIAKKFTRVKVKSFSAIDICSDINYDISKESLAFNTTDFVIGNIKTYKANIAKLFLLLDDDCINLILDNKEIIRKIKEIILFADLIEDFSIEDLANLLSNSKKIATKLGSFYVSNILDSMIDKFYLVINLAKGYSSLDDTIMYSLGDEVVAKLGENVCSEYYNLYKSMLKRKESNIPPVYLEYDNNTYISGDYAEPERLLIGKLYETSCIDLNNPGEQTYLECLNKLTGDAILIRNNKKELKDRMLLIRRGNVVQILMVALHTLPLEVYNNIANQILSQAKQKGDNIDYVVVSRSSINTSENIGVITNPKFITKFPHADLSDSVVFLGNSQYNNINYKDINLKFKDKPKCTYLKKRKLIDKNPTSYELTRIKALQITLEENPYIKERLINSFEPVDPSLYAKTLCGEDWYICLNEDGSYDELILDNGDRRAILEITEIKNAMMEEQSKSKAMVIKKTL